jgi:hypothetical protein
MYQVRQLHEDDQEGHQGAPQDIDPEVVIGELCRWARKSIKNATLEQVVYMSNIRDLLRNLSKDFGNRLSSRVDFLQGCADCGTVIQGEERKLCYYCFRRFCDSCAEQCSCGGFWACLECMPGNDWSCVICQEHHREEEDHEEEDRDQDEHADGPAMIVDD